MLTKEYIQNVRTLSESHGHSLKSEVLSELCDMALLALEANAIAMAGTKRNENGEYIVDQIFWNGKWFKLELDTAPLIRQMLEALNILLHETMYKDHPAQSEIAKEAIAAAEKFLGEK